VKRTPLRRKTPLRRTGPIKPKPRAPEKRTDPGERRHVILRDGCIAYRHDRTHGCRDTWGNPHGPFAYDVLTVDHVHDHAGGTRGVRAPCGGCAQGKPQRAFMTGMCGWLNGGGGAPSAALREFQRAYLAELEAKGML